MTDDKIREVLDRYQRGLDQMSPAYYGLGIESRNQLLSMIPRMLVFLTEGRRDKVFRWLGFMQGVFWEAGVYTIEEMATHNRPDRHASGCPANGNYEPPYEDCTCGLEDET